jgi:uroporphyrinogen decarboxylase
MQTPAHDGVLSMVSPQAMAPSARKLRDIYAIKPGAPLYHCEFGFMEGLRQRWLAEGLDPQADWRKEFGWDEPGAHALWGLGWCEAGFCPPFDNKVLEDRGELEVYQDFAGRGVLVFKGRRNGFMPEYLSHPVRDMKSWRDNCKWRMDATTPERWADFDKKMADARSAAGRGMLISQRVVGAYMYLRSLIGPVELLYAFYDMPDVIHDCMATWLQLADAVTARHQRHVTLDEIFFGEDICYNHGLLISPDMMKEFLLPYYQQLISNVRSRQLDRSRHLYVQIDTDGLAMPAIPLYRQGIGMDVMSPFEVASGCEVTAIARQYGDLVMTGGIDKRVLALGKDAIDRHVEAILPAMRARGGYYPTCDHAVPAEVSLENYRHYRKRCMELGG